MRAVPHIMKRLPGSGTATVALKVVVGSSRMRAIVDGLTAAAVIGNAERGVSGYALKRESGQEDIAIGIDEGTVGEVDVLFSPQGS